MSLDFEVGGEVKFSVEMPVNQRLARRPITSAPLPDSLLE